MSDLLLQIGQNPQARRLIRTLGLPIPLPEPLRREQGPWRAQPLAGALVAVGATDGAELGAELSGALAGAGAELWAQAPGGSEAQGRPARSLGALPAEARLDALVFDATGLSGAASLRALHGFFHGYLGRLARGGRVLVVGRPVEGAGAERAAAQAALEGFVRSVAKEIGRTGATANLVRVAPGAEARLPPALRFVLSARAAFVTAQPLTSDARARAAEPRASMDGPGPAPEGATPASTKPRSGASGEHLEPGPAPEGGKKPALRVALVTGAARGIGEATARQFAAEGAHVVCLDRPADDGATRELARSIGGTPLLVDLADPNAPARVAEALAELGGVDVVVHNAGVTRDKTLARMSPEQWDQVIDINLGAVLRLSAALDRLLRDGGRVVALSSIAGLSGNVGQTAYAASKAGLVGWVRSEAERLADRGVTVNAIAPGFIETRMTATIPVAIRQVARRLSALGQGGLPDDVAQAIAFLASPGAHGVTGRVLRVCGGAFIGA